MAEKRFIARRITESDKIRSLANEGKLLATTLYAFLLPYLDTAGRMNANPLLLKGGLFEGYTFTVEELEAAIQDLARVGLVRLYSNGRFGHLIQYDKFLAKDGGFNTPHPKEPESDLPGPDDSGSEPVITPERGSISAREPSSTQPEHGPDDSGKTPGNVQGEVEVEIEIEVEREGESEGEPSSANADTPPPKPDEPTLRDLIEIWNSECGNLRRVADIELGLANTTLTRLSAAFFKRHRKRPDKGLDIFRAGIPAVVNDPHWLGPRAEKPTRTGNVYGLDNYLRNVETKAEAAAAMTATGPSGRPTGPVRFRVGHAVYRPSTGEYDFIEELLDPQTARMSNGETWNLEGCERWTN